MGSFTLLFGRLLMAIIWIGAGVQKLQDQEKFTKIARVGTNNFNTWISKDLEYGELPLKDLFIENMNHIILLIAVSQIVCGILLVAGNKLGAFCLACLLIPFTFMIHNPFFKKWNEQRKHLESHMFVMNTLIFAGLLMVVGWDSRKSDAAALRETEPKDTRKPSRARQGNRNQRHTK
ncbi:unnamed protein product [Moneuplotes crassus]|uniref:DoxX family protein n=1 Tax=Euplotes crassus TaxID=5936 RepID=A0AAD2D537_EUPCR|nr:unnamed protein product [Moneuplotes crassus]